MALLYNGLNVDQAYAPVIEPNLYHNTCFIPGVTYTDRYQRDNAGGIYVHKLADGTVTAPSTPAADFTHTVVSDSLIQISLNNTIRKSNKMYQVQDNAVGFQLSADLMAKTVEDAREDMEAATLACLLTEGTESLKTTAATKSNVKDLSIGLRTELVKKKTLPDVCLCSPEYYAYILQAAGADFVPSRNERIQTTGGVGTWFGVTYMECNMLSLGAAITYNNYAGTATSVTSANLALVDCVMYNHNALSRVSNINAMRMVDGGKDFIGKLAQIEINSGLRVTNANCVIIKKHAA